MQQISADGYWIWNGLQWIPNPNRPGAARSYESAEFRTLVTSVLLLANIVGTALYTAAIATTDLTRDPGTNLSVALALFVLLAVLSWLGTLVPAIVFFCMWLHRVVRNMPGLGSPDLRWSPARSVVFCFIPILMWFHPLWSALDAWRGADSSARWLNQPARRAIRPPPLFVGWWTAWLGGNFLFNIGTRLSGSGAAVVDVLGGSALCAAAVFCVLVIRQVTARQERKSRLITSGQLV